SAKWKAPRAISGPRGISQDSQPISRILSWTAIPLRLPSLAASSDLPGGSAHRACTHRRVSVGFPPYLVLLPVGFAMRRVSLLVRCALTAPFHPYPSFLRRYLLCGTFRRVALKPPSQALPGTALYGVRTFLSLTRRPGRTGVTSKAAAV